MQVRSRLSVGATSARGKFVRAADQRESETDHASGIAGDKQIVPLPAVGGGDANTGRRRLPTHNLLSMQPSFLISFQET